MLQEVKLRNDVRGRESFRMLTSESRSLSAQIKSSKNQRFLNSRKVTESWFIALKRVLPRPERNRQQTTRAALACHQEADWGV